MAQTPKIPSSVGRSPKSSATFWDFLNVFSNFDENYEFSYDLKENLKIYTALGD